jgi:type II secretory pathway component PulC
MTSSTGASVLNSPILLKVDGTVSANTTASADGSYSFILNNLAAGSHSFQAVFEGSSNFQAASSSPASIAISKADTGLTLTASATQINAGQSVSLTGKLTPNPVVSVLNSNIQFKVDGVIVSNNSTSSLADGSYTFTLNNLGVGSHTIQAVYGESANFKGSSSTTWTVAVAKAAGTLSVTAPTKAVFGQIVAVTAQVLPSQASAYEGAVVTFYDDKKVLGTSKIQSGKAVWNFNSTTVNKMLHFNAKIAETANGKSAVSPMVMMSVGKASTSVSWTIVSKPGNNQEWTIKISPTSPGAGTPTGQIKITLAGARPTTTTLRLTSGKVVYKFRTPTGRPKSIAFVGDTNFSASTKTV